MRLVIGIVLVLGGIAHAKNYAFVLGGKTSGLNQASHDFTRIVGCAAIGLKAKQYEVTTLFGTQKAEKPKVNEPFLPGPSEFERFSEEYKFIKEKVGAKGDATGEGIDEYFAELIAKVKKGDKVEIVISAHGISECPHPNPTALDKTYVGGPPNDFGTPCEHKFQIADEDGRKAWYPSKKIVAYLKELENRGALPNLVMNSCSSGRIKEEVSKLRNTCSYVASSGDSVAHFCGDGDSVGSTDYTSLGDQMNLRYCVDQIPELLKEPVFVDKPCIKKVYDHYQKGNVDLTSIQSTYWSARRVDETTDEPTISTLYGHRYFTQSNTMALYHQKLLRDPAAFFQGFEEMAKSFQHVPEIKRYQDELRVALEAYDTTVHAQAELAKKDHFGMNQKEWKRLQGLTAQAALKVMAIERKLIDELRNVSNLFTASPKENACTRKL